MSLLEDVFLQDEANEAQELERIIEGDEYDERPRSHLNSDDNSEREDEAEEDKRRVDPSSNKIRRVIKNPRFILNPARLSGPRGIQVIPGHFKDFKFKGKGHEKEDLDIVLKKLEHWAYRLYPKFKFEDCLKKIETLGKKRPVMVHLHKIRTDQYGSDDTVVQKDSSDDDALPEDAPPEDEFDKLLQQQIELARSTPAPNSVKKPMDTSVIENRPLIMPKATSSPSISDEQRERILKSRKLAEERRLARLKNASNFNVRNSQNIPEDVPNTPSDNGNVSINDVNGINKIDGINTEITIDPEDNVELIRKVNRTNVIDSSGEEDETVVIDAPIRADIHKDSTNDNHVNSNTKEITEQTNKPKNNIETIVEEGIILENINTTGVLEQTVNPKNNIVTIIEEDIILDNVDNSSYNDKGENDISNNDNITTNNFTVIQNKEESTTTNEEKMYGVQKDLKEVDQNCNAVTGDSAGLSQVPDDNIEELMDVDFNEDF